MASHFTITGFGPGTDDLTVEVVDREDILTLEAVQHVLETEIVADDVELLAGEYDLDEEQAAVLLKHLGHDALPGVDYFIGRRQA